MESVFSRGCLKSIHRAPNDAYGPSDQLGYLLLVWTPACPKARMGAKALCVCVCACVRACVFSQNIHCISLFGILIVLQN